MEIRDIYAARKALERQVQQAIVDFESATGLEVTGFDLDRTEVTGLRDEVRRFAVTDVRATAALAPSR